MDIHDLFPCFPCPGKMDASNPEIEKQIKKDRKMINKTIPILLLGAAECGKSTVLKQVITVASETTNSSFFFQNRNQKSKERGVYKTSSKIYWLYECFCKTILTEFCYNRNTKLWED